MQMATHNYAVFKMRLVLNYASEMVYYYCIHANAGVLWTDVRG